MRGFWLALLSLALLTPACLGASEFLRNRSGETALGVNVAFSEEVTIVGYDEAAFRTQSPVGRASAFSFHGGQLPHGYSFMLSWFPSDASIVSYEWVTGSMAFAEPSIETTEYVLEDDPSSTGVARGRVVRTLERNVLPFVVTYEAALESLPPDATLSWDTDIYVDTDQDGDSENDADVAGASLRLVYTENYNPTVKLVVKASSASELCTWRNMVRNDFQAGVPVLLDGEALLRLAGVSARGATWQQLHMERNSLEYMTEYVADPQDANSLLTQCVPRFAGRYVYALTDEDGHSLSPSLAAWVVESPGIHKRVGILMADIWNDSFAADGKRVEGGGVFFTDEDVREKLRYLSDEGFETVGVHAGIVNEDVLPDPLLTSEAPNLLSDLDLREAFKQIGSPHLTVQSFVSGLADPELGVGTAWSRFDRLTWEYYERYFDQYGRRMLELARIAAETGVAAITVGQNHPYLWGLGEISSISQNSARRVAQEWSNVLRDVRQVFGGEVGLGYALPETPVTAAIRGVPDFVEFTMGGFCDRGNCDFQRYIGATRTAEELRAALVFFGQGVVNLFSQELGAPLMLAFQARSYDGAAREHVRTGHEQSAYDSWKPEYARGGYGAEILDGAAMDPFRPSFRDQTLFLETYLPILARMETVQSIFCQGEYWKMMSFADFAPQHDMEIHQANNGSLQGKPGLQVVKLWASILDPNERNLYRRVRPFAKGGAPETAAGEGEDTPQTAAGLIDDFGDGDLLSERGALWSSGAFDGGKPRVPLETESDGTGHYLLLTKAEDSGMTSTGQFYGTPVSGAGFHGLYVRMTSSAPLAVDVELMSGDSQCEGGLKFTSVGQSAHVDSTIREFRMPFADFLAAQEKCPGTSLQLDVAFIRGLGIYILPGSSGDLRIYEVGFYREGEASPLDVINLGRRTMMPSSEDVASALSSTPVLYSFSSSQMPVQRWLDGIVQSSVVSANWGLVGCRIKSVKMAVVDGGLAVQIAVHDSIHASAYQYDVTFWEPNSSKTALFLALNPETDVASANMMIGDTWRDASSAIVQFGHDDSTLTVTLAGTQIPTGQSISALAAWNVVISVSYVRDDSYESFVFPQTVVYDASLESSGSLLALRSIDWSIVPLVVSYSGNPQFTFWCDGQTNLADSRFWGREGARVGNFRVALTDQGLATRVELHPGDVFGGYGYVIGCRVGGSIFYVFLFPHRNEARLAADVSGHWVELGAVSSGHIDVGRSAVTAWFPKSIYGTRFSTPDLLANQMNLSLEYTEGQRRELFLLQGSGRAVRLGG